MRRIKLFFIVVFLFLMSFSISLIDASAKGYVPDGYLEVTNNERDGMRTPGVTFCHISPHYGVDMNALREQYRNVFAPYGIRGTFEYINRLDVIFDDHVVQTYLMLRIIVEDSIVKEIHYIFDDMEYYYLPISESATEEYHEFTGFDFNEYYGEKVDCCVVGKQSDASGLTIYGSGNKRSFEAILPLLYTDMIFVNYDIDKTNNTVTIDYNNPISREEIAKKVGVTADYIEYAVRVDDYEIISYTYDPDNVSPNNYNIRLRGMGMYQELYIKDITVRAIDYNPIEIDNIFVKYYEPMDKFDILDKVNISIDYNDIDLKTEYFNHTGEIGGYDYSVTIGTADNGIYRKTARIVVVDDLAPEISGPDYLETNTENRLTIDDIKREFRAIDDYSNEGVYIEPEDIGDENNYYQNNYNKAGQYNVRINAYDKFGNHSYKDIVIYVSVGPNSNPSVTSSSESTTGSIPASSSYWEEYTTTSNSTTTSLPSSTSTPTVAPSTSKSSSSTQNTSNTPSATSPATSSSQTSTNYWDQFITSSTSNTTPSTSSSTSTSTPSSKPSVTSSSSTKATSSSVTPSTTTEYTGWDAVLSMRKSYDEMMSRFNKSSSTTGVEPSQSSTPSISSSSSTSTSRSIPTTTPSTSIPTTNVVPSSSKASTSTEAIPSTSKESLDIIPSKSKINIPTVVDSTTTSTFNVETSITPSTTVARPSVEESTTKSTTSSITKRNTSNEEFRLSTSVNNRLTIDNIKDSLLDSDIISIDEYDSVTIESSYFDTPDLGGEYLVTIKYPNGAKISYKLDVVDNNKKTTEKKDSTTLYILIGAGAVILFLIIIIVYMLRKNKNEKKA